VFNNLMVTLEQIEIQIKELERRMVKVEAFMKAVRDDAWRRNKNANL